MKRTVLVSIGLTLALTACSPLIPTKTVQVTDTMSFTTAEIVMVAAVVGIAYLVIDPLAPNWAIQETKLDETRYRIEMRKKRITTGGDGEAGNLFHRHADEIAMSVRSRGYTILSWNEGVQSDFPIAQRWARGEIQVQPTPVTVVPQPANVQEPVKTQAPTGALEVPEKLEVSKELDESAK
ncbi:MAG: hypothetical protein ABI612_21475 [Betaproteobacteria bacterium]